jgi:hypothetical protein
MAARVTVVLEATVGTVHGASVGQSNSPRAGDKTQYNKHQHSTGSCRIDFKEQDTQMHRLAFSINK